MPLLEDGRAAADAGRARSRTREHASERARELVELVRGADRHTDGGRRSEPGERPHDHAFAEQALEQLRRVAPDVDVDEVADRRHRIEPVLAEDLGEPFEALAR